MRIPLCSEPTGGLGDTRSAQVKRQDARARRGYEPDALRRNVKKLAFSARQTPQERLNSWQMGLNGAGHECAR